MLVAANTADAFDAREHYTKYEYLIPMRDGVKLFTSVLVPKDASTPYPFVIVRTPFGIGPYGSDEYSTAATHTDAFLKAGYIWVRQDVRGRRMSEGRFVPMTPHRPEKRTHKDVDESTDTYDTVEWLLQHVPNHNGRVGLWGISYAGFYTAAGIIDTHPAIKVASPQAPVADFFLNDDWYHGGAFKLAAGSVSDPIATDNGTAVIKVVEKKAVTPEEWTSSKDRFREELLSDRRNRFFSAYMAKAKQKMKIEVNRESLQRAVG